MRPSISGNTLKTLPGGLIRRGPVDWIFKSNNMKTAATSVKGGQKGSKSVKTVQIATPQKKTVSKNLANKGGKRMPSIPTRALNHRRSSHGRFGFKEARPIGKHNGLRVTGTIFLNDIISPDLSAPVGTGVATRFIDMVYLHPHMLQTKLWLISQTFVKYRFNKIGISYLGERGTDEFGDLYIAYIPDPDVDPTLLLDKQIKVWLDNVDDVYRGTVFTVRPEYSEFRSLDSELRNMVHDTSTLHDTYQGKLVFACSGTAAKYLGECVLSFDVEMYDEEMDVTQTLDYVYDGPVIASSLTTTAATTASTALSSLTDATGQMNVQPSGIASVQIKDLIPPIGGVSIGNFLDKLYTYGSEFIGALIGKSSKSLTLFDSLADVFVGDQTKAGSTDIGLGTVLKAVVKPLLYSGKASASVVGDAVPKSVKAMKGWEIACRNHVKIESRDVFDENLNCWTVDEWLNRSNALPHIYNPNNVRLQKLDQSNQQKVQADNAPPQVVYGSAAYGPTLGMQSYAMRGA